MAPYTVEAREVKTPEQVREYIIYVASAEGVDVSMALAIAKAESGFNPNAENPKSTASGVYQFLDGTFKAYCINKFKMTDTMEDKNHPAIQVNCAIDMLREKNGYKHWYASFGGWGTYLSVR